MKITSVTLANLASFVHYVKADYGWHFANALSTGDSIKSLVKFSRLDICLIV